mmetsp:Transcript_15288/g.31709  ORF Transcript_15288/g.31709 Transcript_15288/m.31709 type:complete len:857 (+) Transcript_15288:100-2670(+)
MTRLYDEDEHDHGFRDCIDETANPSKRRSRASSSVTKSYRSTISKEGVPTSVALKGGVRGGHSVATMSATHPKPLGLSPADYGSADGNPINTVHSMVSPQHWPKGLTNVGNTCYANAALQCLLSTALTSALLDPNKLPVLRRYSSNPNLLLKGSGSVDSSDSDDDSIGLSIDNDLDEEEDGIFMDSKGVVLSKSFSPTGQGNLKETLKEKQKKASAKAKAKKKKEKKKAKAEDAAKRKERERQRMEETCTWLTRELTSIAQEYAEDSCTSLRQSPVGGASLSGGRSSIVGWLSSSYNQMALGAQPQDTHGVVNPGSITRHPNRLSKCLMPYQQEDAHEFMRALLSNLVMNGHNRKLSSLFDGLLESSVICQVCGRASLTRDRYMDLSVDINDPQITTLDDALFEFTKDELLTEDNCVTCQRCRKKQPVSKGLRLATAPSILVIHLKRFAFNDYGRLVRLHKRIQFPQKLEIGDYMSNLNKARPPPYSLVGVLVHQGQTCASGHYLSFVKKNGEWFKTNDSEVSVVDESTVMMQQAYILMYEVSGMRKDPCFKPKPFRKDSSIMSTIESLDDATLPREDFSVCGTHWSASDKSVSKRSSMHLDGKGTYNNPYGTDHPKSKTTKDESTAESLMRVLRQSGVTRLINDICCDSVSLGINEPETDDVKNESSDNFNYNHAMLLRNSGKYAHECESVDTQDSFIRRQSLLSSKAPNPIHVLEVKQKRKPGRTTRSQTAPRQRGEQNSFHMVTPYSTLTPRASEGSKHGMGTEDGVLYRKFPSNGNLKSLDAAGHLDTESVSSRSTLTSRFSRDSLRSKDRHTFSSTRYSMASSKNEDMPLPPRRNKRNKEVQRSRSKPSRK